MIRVERFKLAHLDNFRPADFVTITPQFVNHLRDRASDPNSYLVSFFIENIIIAIAGVNTIHSGVGELWLLPSKSIPNCVKSFSKVCKNFMDGFIPAKLKLRRVQAHFAMEHTRWARFLGLEYEGTLKAYGLDGSDQYLYARVY